MEQHSITFGPKACFGAALHHFLSKSLLWSNTQSFFKRNKNEVIWGPVRSGPVRSVRSRRSCTGADRTDRTGQGQHRALAKSSLALSGPVRSVRSAPVPWAQDARTGRTGPDRTGRDPGSPHLCFCLKSDGALLQNKLLDKSDGLLLRNMLLDQK